MLELKRLLQEELNNANIQARNASDWHMGGPVEEKGAFISLRQAGISPGAMYGYVGLDAEGNERFGMVLDVKFALVLLSPKKDGGIGAETFGEDTANALMVSAGRLGIREMVCNEAAYDKIRDCFRQEIVVFNQVLAYGVKEDTGIRLEQFCIQALVL